MIVSSRVCHSSSLINILVCDTCPAAPLDLSEIMARKYILFDAIATTVQANFHHA